MSGPMQDAILGKYMVRALLGKGAMGVVYDGWDPVIERRVAIKTVKLPDAHDVDAQEALSRFKREAQAAGRLNHPNIVGVFDYGETSDVAFIVMEFVEGRTLKEVLDGGERLTLGQTLRVLEDVLAGLAYSHSRGVIHRDIKPANIMLTPDLQAKIADFGIARIESSNMTQAGTVLGTPAYMSPEQFMGQTVDRRSDIYSAGVLLYQLLTGERPFEGGLTAIMHKALNTVPPRPSELSVTAPVALDAVVARAMARKPDDRFETAETFALAIVDAVRTRAAVAEDATVVARLDELPLAIATQATPLAVTAPSQALAETARGRGRTAIFVLAAAVVATLGGGAYVLSSGGEKRETANAVVGTSAPERPPAGSVAASAPSSSQLLADKPQPSAAPVQPMTAPLPPAQLAPQAAVNPPPSQLPAVAPSAQTSTTPFPAPKTPDAISQPLTAPSRLSEAEPTPKVPSPVLALNQQPPAPPAVATRAPPSAAETARMLSAVLPTLDCTFAQASVEDGSQVRVTGVAGAGTPIERLRRAVPDGEPTDWHVTGFHGPYCGALDLLRPLAANLKNGTMRTDLVNNPSFLADREIIAVDVTMPEFGGYISVTYLENDGVAAMLVPGAGYPLRAYAPGEKIVLGQPRAEFEGWTVGPPFGTDMILTVASSAQLFATPRPKSEPIAAYLHDLQAAMDDLRRRGGSVAAGVVVLDTREHR